MNSLLLAASALVQPVQDFQEPQVIAVIEDGLNETGTIARKVWTSDTLIVFLYIPPPVCDTCKH